MHHPRLRRTLPGLAALALLVACGSDDAGSDATTASSAPAADSTASTGTDPAVTAGDTAASVPMLTGDRCETNRAAGTITYLTGFDFAAEASIIDVIVADAKGYFDALCLDVEVRSGFSTTNWPLVASNTAQFASGGSFTELVQSSVDGASFVALVDYGKTPINALVTKDPSVTDLAQLAGATIGVKGDIPPALVAMLAQAGLARGTDYEEVLLDGFDPVAQLAMDIDALPVYKNNEPGQLDAAGVPYGLFDPSTYGIPGSFGILYTSAAFAADHPTVVEDFVRAALKGMEDAVADPAAAVALSIERINAAGNQFFLTQDGETFRWERELTEIRAGTPTGPIGLIDPVLLEAEVTAYVEAGVLDSTPTLDGTYDADLAAGLYGTDGKVTFPG